MPTVFQSTAIATPQVKTAEVAQSVEATTTEEEIAKLKNLARTEGAVLYRIRSVFPFNLFPTTLTIEKTKVNVFSQVFFGTTHSESLLISEIIEVKLDTNFFLATLSIISRLPSAQPIVIPQLRQSEAHRAQKIIQGLMVGLTAHVDLSKLPAYQLLDTIEELGSGKSSRPL